MIVTISNVDDSTQSIVLASDDVIVSSVEVSYPISADRYIEMEQRACRAMNATGDRRVVINGAGYDSIVDHVAFSVYVGSRHLHELIADKHRVVAYGAKKPKTIQEIMTELPTMISSDPPHYMTPDEAAKLRPEYELLNRERASNGGKPEEDTTELAVAEKIARIKRLAAIKKRA